MRRPERLDQVIPMAAIGVVVALCGLGLLVLEAHVPGFGIFGSVGILALAGGVGLTVDAAGAPLAVALPLAVILALTAGLSLLVVGRKVLSSHRLEPQSGPERLSGVAGVVKSWAGDEGQVAADGSLWGARTSFGWESPAPIAGDTIVIDRLDGLTLMVRRPHSWEKDPVWKPSELSL